MTARDEHKRPTVAGKRVAASRKPFLSSDGEAQVRYTPASPPSDAESQEGDRSRIATKGSARTGTPRRQKASKNPNRDSLRKPKASTGTTRGGGSPSSSGNAVRERASRKKPVRKGLSRGFLIGSVSAIMVLAVAVGALAWNHWLRYDDAADIQGTWVIDGSQDAITITDTDMVLTEDVSYPYVLDTFQKTISFSFEQYSGNGTYAFSPERDTLVITETDADTGEEVSTKLVKR